MKLKPYFLKPIAAAAALILMCVGGAPVYSAGISLPMMDSGIPPVDSGPPPTETEPPVTLYGDTLYYAAALRGMPFDDMIKPDGVYLWRSDDRYRFYLPVSLSAEDYDRGMASGEEVFPIACIPDTARLNPADKLLWDAGLLALEEPLEFNVRVEASAKPGFTISWVPWNGTPGSYYPKFTFPMPHLATSVTIESSMNGVNWYSSVIGPEECESRFSFFDSDVYNLKLKYTGSAIEAPRVNFSVDKPSWHRMRIVGSLYEGESDIFYYNPLTAPPDKETDDSEEDISGNRGGGGQTAEIRVIPENEITVPPTTAKSTVKKTSAGGGVGSPAPQERGTHLEAPPDAPAEPAAEPEASEEEAARASAGLPEDIPPEREQKTSLPPAVAVSAVLAGGAGLSGWIFLKKKP